jgi:serine/threonine-protein kinase
MAMVFNGKDLMLERDVAVKVLRSRYAKDPAFRERFRQEAKAAANLSHTNIVTVYDFGYDQSRLYIVMEYVAGKDMNSLVHERGRLDIGRGLDLAIQACKGIGYAHRAGLVHCDVKPHNLLVTPHWQLKVTDFGIARALASINRDELSEVVWGSPQFFSPEQASGEAPSPASDVYSLGVVMYLMFTGQLPFIGKNSQELARMHREADPIPPGEINPMLPDSLEQVILKVLSKEPSARYRTADQLGRVLQIVQRERTENGQPSVRRGTSSTQRRHSEPVRQETLTPIRPARRISEQATNMPSAQLAEPAPSMDFFSIDWLAVLLGLGAVVAWGGLVPFFIWVYNSIF